MNQNEEQGGGVIMPFYIPYSEDYLAHHGIKGQKWGVRRWQNADGSLTDAGRIHYGYGDPRERMSYSERQKYSKKLKRDIKRHERAFNRTWYRQSIEAAQDKHNANYRKAYKRYGDDIDNSEEAKNMWDAYDKANRLEEESDSILDENVTKAWEDYSKAEEKYWKKTEELLNEHKGDILGAKLNDLGYEDTQEGREILDSMLDSSRWWDSSNRLKK